MFDRTAETRAYEVTASVSGVEILRIQFDLKSKVDAERIC